MSRYISIILRLILKTYRTIFSLVRINYYRMMYPNISINENTFLDIGVRIKVTDGGSLILGKGVHVERYSSLIVKKGVLSIGDNSFIGERAMLVANDRVQLGDDCLIAANVTIRDQNHGMNSTLGIYRLQEMAVNKIIIGNNVWIGANSVVLKGVSIGDNTAIGANAVVNKDIGNNVLAVGIPAKITKTL